MSITSKLISVALAILMLSISSNTFGQCESWEGHPKQEDGENAHSIYRQAIKGKDWATAFEYWQIAYDIAPAADGKRDYHYTDGVTLYVNMYKNETDEAKKAEYVAIIDRLYSEAIACYESKSITLKCGDSDECFQKRIGYLQGRRAYEMFYSLNAPYSKNLEVIDSAIESSGLDAEYIVFDPLARIVVWEFQKGRMDKDQAIAYYQKMEEIAQHNVINNESLSESYEQAWLAAQAQYRAIEKDVFDCDYFKPILEEEYQDDPSNPDVIKSVLVRLKRRGCPDDDPMVQEIDAVWKTYAAKVNAQKQAEFDANNPGSMAKKMYDEGDFEGAANKFQEAIDAETDPLKKANYLNSLASIKFRKLSQYGEARSIAKKAAGLKPNWGRPYMLIGDMYAKSARSCGDSWNQRLAIIAAIDKYSYAKSIDPSVSDEANSRISRYTNSLPAQDEGFMRGVKAGQSVTVGCWIGESVKVRYN